METITYISEAKGITEQPAINPETGLTDAQAVRMLLDAHHKNIELLKTWLAELSQFNYGFYSRILERMETIGLYPPDDEYYTWLNDREPNELFDWLRATDKELVALNDDLHQRHTENQVECD